MPGPPYKDPYISMILYVYSLLSFLRHIAESLHSRFVAPFVLFYSETVLRTYEEIVKSTIRQTFVELERSLSALSTWALSLFHRRNYRRELRRTWDSSETVGQHQPPSTLNSILAAWSLGSHAQADITATPSSTTESDAVRRSVVQNTAQDELFQQPSGAGVIRRQRGLIEDARINTELTIAQVFEGCRGVLRWIGRMPSPSPSPLPVQLPATGQEDSAQEDKVDLSEAPSRELLLPASEPGQNRGFWSNLGKKLTLRRRAMSQHLSQHEASLITDNRTDCKKQAASAKPRESKPQELLQSKSVPKGIGLPAPPHLPHPSGHPLLSPHFSLNESEAIRSYPVRSKSPPISVRPPPSTSKPAIKRASSFGRAETVCQHISEVSCAADVIRLAGYPLEQYQVVTEDGFVIQMERIPRHGARDVVFYLHGVLDTSMSWVSGGVTGSQAFAAWEAGFDVWLGNTRNNAPRIHLDPDKMRGPAYWRYNMNHIGLLDTGAQLDFIDRVKRDEAITHSQERASVSSSSSLSSPLGTEWSKSVLPLRQSLLPPPTPCAVKWTRGGEQGSFKASSRHSLSNGRWSSMFFRQPPDKSDGTISRTQSRSSQGLMHTSTSDSNLCDQDAPKSYKGRPHETVKTIEGGFKKSSSQSHIPLLEVALSSQPPDPYCLRAVGHSLGGMSLLMHCVARGPASSHVHRLILLTPAGFHVKRPRIAEPIAWFLPTLLKALRCIYPRFACPVVIPTTLFRGLFFKLWRDIHSIPALVDLVKLVFKVLLSNDASQWERVVQMPHYNATSMPTASIFQILHLVQISRSGKFQMFDYGSRKANLEAYGSEEPLDIASYYSSRLKGVPVDLVAGTKDGIISDQNVKIHRDRMEAVGLDVSYREFSYGHLDFTFAVKEELRNYLLKLIRRDV